MRNGAPGDCNSAFRHSPGVAFWVTEQDFFDLVVPDGGGFQAGGSQARVNILLVMSS